MTLFTAGSFVVDEFAEAELPELQALFESNPGYFELVEGAPAEHGAARKTFESRPPADMPYTRNWMIGARDAAGALVGFIDVVEDLLAPRAWHVAFFIVAGGVHGRGVGREIYAALEQWMRGQGARWLRLGVVDGNARAERFWRAQGYAEVTRKRGVEMGRKTHTVLAMIKPCGGTLEEYLALVPSDRPE